MFDACHAGESLRRFVKLERRGVLHRLFEIGRQTGQHWLKTHFRNLGVRSTAIEAPLTAKNGERA